MTEPAALQYRYFVSFAYNYGFGNTEIALAKPVRGHSDIQVINKILAENGIPDACVLNVVPLPILDPAHLLLLRTTD